MAPEHPARVADGRRDPGEGARALRHAQAHGEGVGRRRLQRLRGLQAPARRRPRVLPRSRVRSRRPHVAAHAPVLPRRGRAGCLMLCGMLDLAASRPAPEDLDALAGELSDALDPRRVARGADVRRQHGTDESFHPPAPPDIVVWPRTVEEAAAVVRACARRRTPDRPLRCRHLARGPRRRPPGRGVRGHVADGRRPAAVGRGPRRHRPGRRHPAAPGRAAAPGGRLLPRGSRRGRDPGRHGRHGRVGDHDRPLRRHARERPEPARRDRGRRGGAHALARAQVVGGLRPHAPLRRARRARSGSSAR
jgi:hypothetical protein